MASVTFLPLDSFKAATSSYSFLPFRFMELDGRMLLVNEAGEHLLLQRPVFEAFVDKRLHRSAPEFADLKARHFLYEESPALAVRLLATNYRTRRQFLDGFTKLHLFVVTLRCEHSCHYCQVSRVSQDRDRYDMSADTAARAVDLVFRSPSEYLKIEFQGGEPLLNFDRITEIVFDAEQRAATLGKWIEFVITTNLALITDDILAFCRDHQIALSTSLDGPAALHNANRPRPGNDSYELTVAGIARAREVLGRGGVSALMTTTQLSLSQPREIVDEYVRQGFDQIVLRPMSPYGFALRSAKRIGYETEAFLAFYKQALDYILELNRQGRFFMEGYARLLLTRIVTPFPTGYVDLQSPAGAGISVAVYNYDGDVYATDESRMLAEMGDRTFRLGNVGFDSYESMFLGDLVKTLVAASCVESLPGCADCALNAFCGSDPIENHATQGDFIGHRPTSAFCRRNMEIIKHLLRLLHSGDAETRQILLSWVAGAPRQELLRQDC